MKKSIEPEYVGVAEAEAMTSRSRWSWRRDAYGGAIASVKIGTRLLIPISEIRRVLAENTRPSSEEGRGAGKMPSVKQVNSPGNITKGDIFDDLGLSPQEALEAKVKADIWRDLLAHIEKLGMDRSSLAHALKVHQSDVSNLMRGKFSKFSTSKLIALAVRLNMGVQVKLTAPIRMTHGEAVTAH
jgi:predicted XRE-type DNA-binding protein